MGFSRTEFIRVLPRALSGYLIESQGVDRWHISDPQRKLLVSLRIDVGPERCIGALRLPVLAVEMEFLAAEDGPRRDFLRRFERGFHKGGG